MKLEHKPYIITPKIGQTLPSTDLKIIKIIDEPEKKVVILKWGQLRVHVTQGHWAKGVVTSDGKPINIYIPDPTENDEVKIAATGYLKGDRLRKLNRFECVA